MPDEKPLHVRVAEALGWRDCGTADFAAGRSVEWFGIPPGKLREDLSGDWPEVPRYDTDWSATGPLLERYEISLIQTLNGTAWFAASKARLWAGDVSGDLHWDEIADCEDGETPLIAVCNLLLELAAAGQLPIEHASTPEEK